MEAVRDLETQGYKKKEILGNVLQELESCRAQCILGYFPVDNRKRHGKLSQHPSYE
jgi:hypothetical protein